MLNSCCSSTTLCNLAPYALPTVSKPFSGSCWFRPDVSSTARYGQGWIAEYYRPDLRCPSTLALFSPIVLLISPVPDYQTRQSGLGDVHLRSDTSSYCWCNREFWTPEGYIPTCIVSFSRYVISSERLSRTLSPRFGHPTVSAYNPTEHFGSTVNLFPLFCWLIIADTNYKYSLSACANLFYQANFSISSKSLIK